MAVVLGLDVGVGDERLVASQGQQGRTEREERRCARSSPTQERGEERVRIRQLWALISEDSWNGLHYRAVRCRRRHPSAGGNGAASARTGPPSVSGGRQPASGDSRTGGNRAGAACDALDMELKKSPRGSH